MKPRESDARRGKILLGAGIFILAAAAYLLICMAGIRRRSVSLCTRLAAALNEVLPPSTYVDPEVSQEDGLYTDDLPVLAIEGCSLVGLLVAGDEPVKAERTAVEGYPLGASYETQPLMPVVMSGSPGGGLTIRFPGYKQLFGTFKKLKQGDVISLRTADGRLYRYEVEDSSRVTAPEAGEADLLIYARDGLTRYYCLTARRI